MKRIKLKTAYYVFFVNVLCDGLEETRQFVLPEQVLKYLQEVLNSPSTEAIHVWSKTVFPQDICVNSPKSPNLEINFTL